MLEAWSPKEITTLILQGGALGLCFLILLIGVWALFQLLAKIDRLHDGIFKLSCLVVDRNARPQEITPPSIPRQPPFDPDKTSTFPPYRGRD